MWLTSKGLSPSFPHNWQRSQCCLRVGQDDKSIHVLYFVAVWACCCRVLLRMTALLCISWQRQSKPMPIFFFPPWELQEKKINCTPDGLKQEISSTVLEKLVDKEKKKKKEIKIIIQILKSYQWTNFCYNFVSGCKTGIISAEQLCSVMPSCIPNYFSSFNDILWDVYQHEIVEFETWT